MGGPPRRVPRQVEADVRGGHIEHQFKLRAWTHWELAVERFERLARLAVDGENEGFRAGYRDGCQTPGRGVAKAKAHTRARPGAEFQWRRRAIGQNVPGLAAASPPDRGIGER